MTATEQAARAAWKELGYSVCCGPFSGAVVWVAVRPGDANDYHASSESTEARAWAVCLYKATVLGVER